MAGKLDIDLTKYADPAELRVDTPAFQPSVGVKPDTFGDPRPEFNGQRMKLPGSPAIYLVDQGFRRLIPDPPTYNNLFRDWNGIVENLLVVDVPVGAPIANGSILARGAGTPNVYFVEAGTNPNKRGIGNPHTMDVYYFSWDRIYVVPLVLVLGIADGPGITAP